MSNTQQPKVQTIRGVRVVLEPTDANWLSRDGLGCSKCQFYAFRGTSGCPTHPEGTLACAGGYFRAAPPEAAPAVDPHAPGAKLDAGKAEYDMVLFSFPNALPAVNAVGEFGATKYTKGGFLSVPHGIPRYQNAGVRHLVSHLGGEIVDPESKHLHLAHAAWNALAALELYLREEKTYE